MAWESGVGRMNNGAVTDATREALEAKPVEWLAKAIANDNYERIFPVWNERNQRSFDKWVTKYSQLPHDVLVDVCMERAERTNSADNGGGMIWIDKGGCSKVKL